MEHDPKAEGAQKLNCTLSETGDVFCLKLMPTEHSSMLVSKLEMNIHVFLFGNFPLIPREGSYSTLLQGFTKENSSEEPSRK